MPTTLPVHRGGDNPLAFVFHMLVVRKLDRPTVRTVFGFVHNHLPYSQNVRHRTAPRTLAFRLAFRKNTVDTTNTTHISIHLRVLCEGTPCLSFFRQNVCKLNKRHETRSLSPLQHNRRVARWVGCVSTSVNKHNKYKQAQKKKVKLIDCCMRQLIQQYAVSPYRYCSDAISSDFKVQPYHDETRDFHNT